MLIFAHGRHPAVHPGEGAAVQPAEQLVDDQADQADQDDAGEDLVGLQEALRLEDRVAQPGVGGHQLGHHQVGPGPAHGDAQRVQQRRLGAPAAAPA